jgi:hypothetical protein
VTICFLALFVEVKQFYGEHSSWRSGRCLAEKTALACHQELMLALVHWMKLLRLGIQDGRNMNEELNKELCELLGICWHEEVPTDPVEYRLCTCGVHIENLMFLQGHCKQSNPDFTTDSGKVQLLREMEKRKDSYGFFLYNGEVKTSWDGRDLYNISVDYLLDNTGKLAIAARDFLKGQ